MNITPTDLFFFYDENIHYSNEIATKTTKTITTTTITTTATTIIMTKTTTKAIFHLLLTRL